MNTTTIIIHPELDEAVAKTGLSADGAASLRDAFAPHFARFHDLATQARTVAPADSKGARALRLQVKAVRVEADKTRKLLKEDSLRRGKAIDGINAVLEYSLVPIERALEDIEKAEEIATAARRDTLRMERSAELLPYLAVELHVGLDLGAMSAELWAPFLAGTKANHAVAAAMAAKQEADRLEALRLAEAARVAREAAEQAERDRMRADNERLAKVAADERAAREQAEATAKAERTAADLAAKKAKDEFDAKAAAEKKRQDHERDRQQEIARIEREKREAAEAEVRRLRDAEAAKVAADAAAVRKAKAAPDREKVLALAAQVRALPVPTLATGEALAVRIAEQVAKLAAWLESEAVKL